MKTLNVVALTGLALLFTGCASTKNPTFAEATLMRSQEASKIAKDWDAGEKLSKKGERALKLADKKQAQAEKLQKEVVKLREDGTQWSSKGETMKKEAEARYQDMRAQPIPTNP